MMNQRSHKCPANTPGKNPRLIEVLRHSPRADGPSRWFVEDYPSGVRGPTCDTQDAALTAYFAGQSAPIPKPAERRTERPVLHLHRGKP